MLERVNLFKEGATDFAKFLMQMYDQLTIYQGRSENPLAGYAYSYLKEVETGGTQTLFMYFLDGMTINETLIETNKAYSYHQSYIMRRHLLNKANRLLKNEYSEYNILQSDLQQNGNEDGTDEDGLYRCEPNLNDSGDSEPGKPGFISRTDISDPTE